ncbi:MAG: polyribonucleotide nucleotidyltransferase, partial [Gemmatimonadetes bacterium]|nr:polyribonucleotide nucleotidyltransferase [Gemmatimonadota bacterium]
MISTFEMEVGGRILTLETGRFAGLADGAVSVRYGDTMVLATACASKNPREGADFLPLTVDVEEKMYAAGKVPGGFFRREGRPSSDAVLMARLIDRPLRPLFPKRFFNDVQIVVTVLSADRVEQPDTLGIIGAAAALTISDIPFDQPLGACRIGLSDGELVVNPTFEESESGLLDLVVAGTGDAVMMVEAGAREVNEEVIVDALELAQEVNGAIVDLIREMREKVGKQKRAFEPGPAAAAAERATREFLGDSVRKALAAPGDKQTRQTALAEIEARLVEALGGAHNPAHLTGALHDEEAAAIRDAILRENRRPDGRRPDEIRPLSSETGLLPRVHGSALFTRGETQVLSSVTLASLGDAQRLDTLSPQTEKRFLHHYNFPPYSTGEVRRMGTG